jgi:hypothetical protein
VLPLMAVIAPTNLEDACALAKTVPASRAMLINTGAIHNGNRIFIVSFISQLSKAGIS